MYVWNWTKYSRLKWSEIRHLLSWYFTILGALTLECSGQRWSCGPSALWHSARHRAGTSASTLCTPCCEGTSLPNSSALPRPSRFQPCCILLVDAAGLLCCSTPSDVCGSFQTFLTSNWQGRQLPRPSERLWLFSSSWLQAARFRGETDCIFCAFEKPLLSCRTFHWKCWLSDIARQNSKPPGWTFPGFWFELGARFRQSHWLLVCRDAHSSAEWHLQT